MKTNCLLCFIFALLVLFWMTACGAPRIIWEFKSGDYIESAPTVAGAIVFFGSLDGYMYAVDAKTGQLRWKFHAEQKIFAPATVADGVVYFGDGDGHFYALDAQTGEQRWRIDMGSKSGIFMEAPPVVSEDRVYFDAIHDFPKFVHRVHAVNTKTGQEEWNRDARSPTIADGVLYFGDDTYFYAWDLQSDKEKWRFKTQSRVTSSSAALNGMVYFGDADGYVYAVDTRTGEQRWRFETTDGLIYAPAIAEGITYVGGSDDSLYALDAQTGEEKWRFTTKGEVNRPAIKGGVVYITSQDGHLYALDAKTGEEKWNVRSRLRLTEAYTIAPFRICSSPALEDGMIYFGSDDGYLYAVKVE